MMTPEQAAEYQGMKILTVKEFTARFAELGYTVDRTMDCKSVGKFMATGETYPVITTSVKETDTGMSAFHYQARRDDKFKAMQKLRNDICAITKGCILEI